MVKPRDQEIITNMKVKVKHKEYHQDKQLAETIISRMRIMQWFCHKVKINKINFHIPNKLLRMMSNIHHCRHQ